MNEKPKPEGVPHFYTVAEAARVLKVSEIKVREAVREGRLRAARLGRIYRILEEDLLRFFEEHLVASKKEI